MSILEAISRVRALALLGLVCLAAGCGSQPARPDVILIVVDTLRADHMSLHGYGRGTTPVLERLAEGGTVFERCFAGSSWTMPSTVMLMLGSYDARNGGRLDQPWPSLAESFSGAGYRTAAVLANPILVGLGDHGDSGFARGFDRFDVVPRRFGLKKGEKRQTNGWYGDEVVRRAIRELDSDAARPDFLWLQLFDPHAPRAPKERDLFAGSADPGFAPAVELSPDELGAISEERRLYDAEVHGADAAIGQLVDWLEAEGRMQNTLIVVTADHGEGLWQRRLPEGEQAKKNNPVPALYSDHGIMLTDEQIHVPLLVAGPGVPVGVRVTQPVSLVDVAPTLRSLADLPVSGADAELAGRDLLGERPLEALPVFSFCSRASSVLVDGRWRLVVPSEARSRNHGDTAALYDILTDPRQLAPISPSNAPAGAPDPEQLARLLAAMRSLATPEATGSGDEAEREARRRELLDDLGYVDQ